MGELLASMRLRPRRLARAGEKSVDSCPLPIAWIVGSLRKPRPQITLFESLHPRYWGAWLLLGFMWLLGHLPHAAQQRVGRWLGKLGYAVGGSRRKMANANIRACFPERSPEEQDALVRDTFIANSIGMVECTRSWFGDMTRYRRDLRIDGLELLQAGLDRGKGVLLYGGHFSILDFALPLVDAIHPVAYMYRPNRNKLLDRVIENRRAPYRHDAFSKRELHALIAYLQAGNLAWYAFDQDLGAKHSVFAPFFGVQTATLKTLGWLTRKSGATPLFLSQWRDDHDGHYRLRFREIPDEFPSDDDVQDATILNAMMEEEIRRDPAQYLWLHRRFKTRPPGEASIY